MKGINMGSVVPLYATLCDSMDYSSPGSSVNEIFQARTLEWVAISYLRGSSRPRDLTQVSCIAGVFFTNWATWEAPECQHAQWLSVMQLVDATPLSSLKLSLPPALALFSSTFPCWGWKRSSFERVPSLKESKQLHYFSSQCKNQVWPLLLLHQEERIRTWENHYKKQQLLSSVLLHIYRDTSVLSSSSILLNWGKKKGKGQNLQVRCWEILLRPYAAW